MDLNEINKQYLLNKNLYDSVLTGLSSTVIGYRNGVLSLRLVVGRKWKKSRVAAAREAAHASRDFIPEFRNALACKVYLIDLRVHEWDRVPQSGPLRTNHICLKGILFQPGVKN